MGDPTTNSAGSTTSTAPPRRHPPPAPTTPPTPPPASAPHVNDDWFELLEALLVAEALERVVDLVSQLPGAYP